MRPIHIGNIDANYQRTVDEKAKEIGKLRTDLHLYQLAAAYKKNNSEANRTALKNAKDEYKNAAEKIYKKAASPLKKRIGNYCCYCERKFPNGLAIEHKCPKDLKENWNLILKWNNFLISCATCNSKKNKYSVIRSNISSFLFPDIDDTYHSLSYKEENNYLATPNNGFVSDPYLRARIHKTINMLRLSEKEDINDIATRCYERREKAKAAKKWHSVIQQKGLCDLYLELIESGVKDGCWSVWMNELEDIPVIKEILLYALPNTAIEYFIDNYWEHERFLKEQHNIEEYYYRLLVVIRIRTVYIAGHIKKLSPFQKEGIIDWITNFVREVRNKIQFTPAQIIRIDAAIATLKAM